MSFFLRYIVAYVIVGVALLALIGYMGYESGWGTLTWVAVGVFALWMFGYHGTMLWLDYRRVAQLVADIRAGRLDQHLQPDRLRESIRHLAVRYGGVPDLIAGLMVRYIVTDDVVRQLVARLPSRAS